jgi:hypothetical protein
VDIGVSAKFWVQIINKMDDQIILNKVVDHPKTVAISAGRTVALVKKNLLEGIYSIRIKYLEGVPELPLRAQFVFTKAYHAK